DTEGKRAQCTTLIQDYLNNHIANTLTQDSVEELETPISLDKLCTALKLSKRNKAPGPDEFPASYY
ncbi:Hypothetical predicted protein, partial [Pelobates cultripes]